MEGGAMNIEELRLILDEAHKSEKRADLSHADLSRADLSRADLSRADLNGADLSHANLSHADLNGADLRWANGPFSLFYGGQHHGVATCTHISIGCERHTHTEWRERYVEIGAANGYNAEEIGRHRGWIFSLDYLIAVAVPEVK
jgi:hypothetical protein